MTILAFFEQTARVQGSPIVSFRSELFALISAIHMIEGDETLVSDCTSVLLRANRNYQCPMIHLCVSSADTYEFICAHPP